MSLGEASTKLSVRVYAPIRPTSQRKTRSAQVVKGADVLPRPGNGITELKEEEERT